MACAEIVSVGVDKTSVVEKGPARFLDDWERPFDGGASEGLTAQWLTIGISRTNVAKFEAAQIVRAAQEEPIVNANLVSGAPIINSCNFPVEQQDRIQRQMKIF